MFNDMVKAVGSFLQSETIAIVVNVGVDLDLEVQSYGELRPDCPFTHFFSTIAFKDKFAGRRSRLILGYNSRSTVPDATSGTLG